MPNTSKSSLRNQLYLLIFAHSVVDTYALTLPHLLPLLLKKLASQTLLQNSVAGRIIAVSSAFSSLGQVVFGRLADRTQSIHFLTFGIALTAVCTSLMGVVPSIPLLLLTLAIGGAGIAAFHPRATVRAAALAKQGRGFGVSLFITGGNVGQAVGPFCIMLLLNGKLERLAWFMIPGLVLAFIVAKTAYPLTKPPLSLKETRVPVLEAKTEKFWQIIRPHRRTLIVLYLITTCRTLTTVGMVNFLSLYLDSQHYPNLARSGVLALFIFAGSIGIMTGGALSDRINRYRLLLFSLIAGPPLLYASLHSTGGLFLLLLCLGNFVLSSSITVNIVLAQQLLSEHENIASSLMMGAAWGVAGLLNYPVGLLADGFGLSNVLNGLVMVPLAAATLMLFLKREK